MMSGQANASHSARDALQAILTRTDTMKSMTAAMLDVRRIASAAIAADASALELPDDVRRLVIAARECVYGNDLVFSGEAELEAAAEAFASRVPWDNEP